LTDSNPCGVLSMHQPWASLLVHGIKRIEGRSWPTDHRGRLWIHATSTKPTDEQVQELERFYRDVHGMEGNEPAFPSCYPTSALLGTVDVTDCVKAEHVLSSANLPESLKMEAQSPEAWLCENPKRLAVPQKMRGHPYIWELPRKELEVFARALRDPPGLLSFSWSTVSRSDPADQP